MSFSKILFYNIISSCFTYVLFKFKQLSSYPIRDFLQFVRKKSFRGVEFSDSIYLSKMASSQFVILKGTKVFTGTEFLFNENDSEIKIGTNCKIGRRNIIGGNKVIFYENVRTHNNCVIIGSVKIYSNCILSANIYISSGNHFFRLYPERLINDQDSEYFVQPNNNLEVIIEEDVWIGWGVVIMPGIIIGRGSVIGAQTVVTKNVPPYTVVAGVPSKFISTRLNFQPQRILNPLDDFSLPYFYRGFYQNISLLNLSRKNGLISHSEECEIAIPISKRIDIFYEGTNLNKLLNISINGYTLPYEVDILKKCVSIHSFDSSLLEKNLFIGKYYLMTLKFSGKLNFSELNGISSITAV